jgi:F-type H+-transporting ATPase subunit delta
MQASDRVLAWRYGRALFEAAAAKNEEGKVQQDFQQGWPIIREMMPLIRNPRVSTAEKKKKLEAALGGKITQTTTKFLGLLIEKKRFDLLPMVINDLGKLVNEKNNIAKAQVRAAKPLSADQQQKLKDKLKAFAGKNIELEIKEDPEIIGGVVVRLGDWVLDSSLRGQLKKMKESLTNGN